MPYSPNRCGTTEFRSWPTLGLAPKAGVGSSNLPEGTTRFARSGAVLSTVGLRPRGVPTLDVAHLWHKGIES
jgi:hypothetical protein